MTSGTYTYTPHTPLIARLRGWRAALAFLLLVAVVVGGGIWLLKTYGRSLKPKTAATAAQTPVPKQSYAYEPESPAKGTAAVPEQDATLLRQMADLQRELQEQREILDALRRQKAPVKANAKASERKAAPGPMLFVSHDVAEPPPAPSGATYTLGAGVTKIPCIVETAMHSNVEGYFTAKVTTHVYDTTTGRHVLIPQSSTILGHDQSRKLLYGDERMDTVSLTLTLPDGREVDLGHAPVTDQEGVAGLTGEVDQHYWRLFGAVFIGGALKGGMSAMQVAMSDAAGAGQVTSGMTSLGNQATNRVVSPMLNTRPTIKVKAAQLCQVGLNIAKLPYGATSALAQSPLSSPWRRLVGLSPVHAGQSSQKL